MKKLKTSKDYYKQKWLQLIREVNKLSPNDEWEDIVTLEEIDQTGQL